jgi:cyclopropane-fatty-acyl-phospholipid synthase
MEPSAIELQLADVQLQIHRPSGSVQRIGDRGQLIDWHLHQPDNLKAILKHPESKLGSSYVRGEWDVGSGQLPELVQALVPRHARPQRASLRPAWRRLRARIPFTMTTRHQQWQWQDISASIARLCLGEERFLTCGEFAEPGFSLEQAQRSRCRRLIAQLKLQPGQRVLVLNAGWGSLALFLAQQADVRVTAIVKSREQLQHAESETRHRKLDGRVYFKRGSFHCCRNRYDRILANGFLEQYPVPSHPVLFKRLRESLEDDGFAWLQVMSRSKDASLSNHWYQAQLPAHNSLPLLSDLVMTPESAGFTTLLLENLGSHWIQTLQSWGQRLFRHRADIARRFGEPCTRHWEFLLASQIAAARWKQLTCHELLLGNSRSTWLAQGQATQTPVDSLPVDVANAIPGLTPDT